MFNIAGCLQIFQLLQMLNKPMQYPPSLTPLLMILTTITTMKAKHDYQVYFFIVYFK